MQLAQLTRRVGAFMTIPAVLAQARRKHRASTLGIARQLCKCLKLRYLPEEALSRGLLNPSVPDSEFEKSCSRSDMSRLQHMRNPATWEWLLADKGIFYRYCQAARVPIPPLYALWSRHTPGWTCTGTLIARRDDWVRFLERDCPPDIVIKPSRSMYGYGIRLFTRENGRFRDPAGQLRSAAQIIDGLIADRGFDMFVIQQRMRNHPAIEQLNGTEALHTLRMITVAQSDGECVVILAKYKVIGGDQFVDNLRHGSLGNLSMEVDLATGALCEPYLEDQEAVRLHPKSGRPLTGFRIPGWEETLDSVRACALKFLPIGTVGWDVAVTATGPVIIEGNVWYDPPSPNDVRPILAALKAIGDDRPSPRPVPLATN